MKYVNQLDYPDIPYITRTELTGAEYEKGQNTTVRSSGCGLCAAVMVAHRLIPNCDFELIDALALSYNSKANFKRGTSYSRYAPALCEKLGLTCEKSVSAEELKNCLATGGAAVALVCGNKEGRVGLFTHREHYITIIGFEPDGRVAVLDPSYKEGKYEEEGRAGKVEMKNGVIALCDVNEIVLDKIPDKPLFYLFRRK